MADAERVAWQDRYLVQQLPNTITVGANAIIGPRITPVFDTSEPTTVSAIGNVGIYGNGDANTGRFLMKLTDHPHLPMVSGTVDTPLTMGTSARNNMEYIQTISEPGTVTLNMQAHVYNLTLFMYSLFQTGYQESAFPTAATNHKVMARCVPYEVPDVDIYLGLMRLLQRVGTSDYDRSSHVSLGSIVSSLTFTGETGGIMTLAAEVQTGETVLANRPGLAQNNSRSQVRPIPISTADNAIVGIEYWDGAAWNSPAAAGDVSVVASSEAFTDLSLAGTYTVEIAADTGELNVGPAAQVDAATQVKLFPGDGTALGEQGGVQAFANQRFEQEPPLLFQDCNIMMGDPDTADSSLTQVYLPGFTLTLANNVEPHFYDEPFIQKWLLGQLTGEGSISIPWGTPLTAALQNVSEANKALENFRQGQVTKLIVYWKDLPLLITSAGFTTAITGNEDNYRMNMTAVKLHIRYNEGTVEGDTELMSTVPFNVVSVFDAEYPIEAAADDYEDYPAVEIQMVYDDQKLDRGAGAIQWYSPFTHTDTY